MVGFKEILYFLFEREKRELKLWLIGGLQLLIECEMGIFVSFGGIKLKYLQ